MIGAADKMSLHCITQEMCYIFLMMVTLNKRLFIIKSNKVFGVKYLA